MKTGKKLQSYILALAAASVFIIPIYSPAGASQAPPKQRVEREFRQLETALGRCMYDEILPSQDIEEMNRALFDFMRENPGVVRILRANVGGIIVSDVSAGSPRSAPPRDISGQRWFRHVVQNQRPYYSMDPDTISGDITLFYAWPLLTGPDRDRMSGAYAALIDFSAQAALIDDAAPFRIMFRGRAIFQHDWDDPDYGEEALDVRGTQGLTILTAKPSSARAGARPASGGQRPAPQWMSENPEDDDAVESLLADTRRNTRPRDPGFSIINTGIFALLLLIAIMLAYSILKDLAKPKQKTPLYKEDPAAKPDQDRVIVKSMADGPPPPMPPPARPQAQKTPVQMPLTPPTAPPPQIKPDANKTAANNNKNMADKPADHDKDQAAMSKMLKLIKEEFVIMDKKIQMLSQRIEELEKSRRR